MKTETYRIWKPEEYFYKHAFGFVPKLNAYLHDDGLERPCMIVAPGGAYCVVSPTEGELVARKFYEKGYQAFVLTYTVNVLWMAPLKLQPLRDISRAVRYIRSHAGQFQVAPDQVALCGFSAGGHLCGSLCVHYGDVPDTDPEYENVSNRPDAAVLCYPVITAGEKAHRDSFVYLLGEDAPQEEVDYMSLEKHVSKDTPPAFVWATATDESVPVENSEYYVEACRRHGVPCAFHMFSRGRHGLSLADEDWAERIHMDTYPREQMLSAVHKVRAGEVTPPAELQAIFEEQPKEQKDQAIPEVAVWPELADAFIKSVWQKER